MDVVKELKIHIKIEFLVRNKQCSKFNNKISAACNRSDKDASFMRQVVVWSSEVAKNELNSLLQRYVMMCTWRSSLRGAFVPETPFSVSITV